MKSILVSLSIVTALLCAGVFSGCIAADTQKWAPLFDGTTLDGWVVRGAGGKATFEVKDGMIVGTTAVGSRNTFLCTVRDYADFVFEAEVLCDDKLNSGFQFRGRLYTQDTPRQDRPGAVWKAGMVFGYQCELEPPEPAICGNVWDEARRNKFLDDFTSRPEAQKAFQPGRWNHYRIVAQGDHIRTFINGVPCADFRDSADRSGFIGLQVHSLRGKLTGPFQVRWKNLRIRELAADALPFKRTQL